VKRGQLQKADAGAKVEELDFLNFAGSRLVWAEPERLFPD